MDFLKEINEKYSVLEAEVDKILEKAKCDEEKLERMNKKIAENSILAQNSKPITYEAAIARNTQLLKNLEISKARLRSRTTFSPVEHILEKAIENYKRDLKSTHTPPPIPTKKVQNPESHDQSETKNVYEVVE